LSFSTLIASSVGIVPGSHGWYDVNARAKGIVPLKKILERNPKKLSARTGTFELPPRAVEIVPLSAKRFSRFAVGLHWETFEDELRSVYGNRRGASSIHDPRLVDILLVTSLDRDPRITAQLAWNLPVNCGDCHSAVASASGDGRASSH
jgi:hypothetical protein